MRERNASVRWLVAAFLGVTLSFVAAATYSAVRATSIDRPAIEIATLTAPAILHLSAARIELRRLDQILRESPSGEQLAALRAAWRSARGDLMEYLPRSTAPRERAELSELIERFDSRLAQPEIAPLQDLSRRLAITALSATQRSGERAEQLALQIERLREASFWASATLNLCALACSLVTAWLLSRSLKRQMQLAEENARMEKERADELDLFAARVAHDLRNPITAVSLALSAAERASAWEQAREMIKRAQRALVRATRITDALLTFARSGAQPDPGARCDVGEVMTGAIEELRETAAGAQVELQLQPTGAMAVRCAPGMLTSVLENLVGNAIKHMGRAEERRVEVRVSQSIQRARIEVEDTGPGVPQNAEDAIFNAYVRGAPSETSGLGIGLATVKRVAEAYGGATGVKPRDGGGSIFWIELPKIE